MPSPRGKIDWINVLMWGGGILFSIMFYVVLYLIITASIAEAQPHGYAIWGEDDGTLPPMTYYEKTDESPVGSEGHILYYNDLTLPQDNEDFTSVETPMGTFTFQMDLTPNADCVELCPDRATLYSAPDGWTVVPHEMILGEYRAGRFIIFPVLGM